MLKIILSTVFVAATLAVGGVWWKSSAASEFEFREAAVERGSLMVTLSATGTIEPEEVVDVGAQVAGIIRSFGLDEDDTKAIDYGTVVEPGTVLARIDDSLYKEEVQLANAQLAQAKSQQRQAELAVNQSEANVKRAEADLQLAKAKLQQATRDRTRGEKLRGSSAIALQELDTLQSVHEQAVAAVSISEAALVQAQSTLESSKSVIAEAQGKVDSASAQLRKAEANLSYTTIRSPIHGVIIDRRVNIGQTVVASLNAPSLFLIAKDLQKLEIWASVNEADIGQIKTGQKVRFTVDAHPEDTFRGEVNQIRLNATMTQNVVTYTVVVTVDNEKGRLLPYLTANLQFEVDRRTDVLTVPNAALRWQPRLEIIHPEFREQIASERMTITRSAAPGGPPEGAGRREGGEAGGGPKAGTSEGGPGAGGTSEGGQRPAGGGSRRSSSRNQGTVWVTDGDFVRPLKVKTGATDGNRTEISGEGVVDGMKLVLGESRKTEAAKTVNPFQPQVFPSRRGS